MSTISYFTNFLKYSQIQIWSITQRNDIKKTSFWSRINADLPFHKRFFKKQIWVEIERSSKNLE